MPRGWPSPAIGTWSIVPAAACALAIAIFVFDTFTQLDAVGIFYVAVVLMVVRSFETAHGSARGRWMYGIGTVEPLPVA
jgi:hypothetical protein